MEDLCKPQPSFKGLKSEPPLAFHLQTALEKLLYTLESHGGRNLSRGPAKRAEVIEWSRTYQDPDHSIDEQRFITVGIVKCRKEFDCGPYRLERQDKNHQRPQDNAARAITL